MNEADKHLNLALKLSQRTVSIGDKVELGAITTDQLKLAQAVLALNKSIESGVVPESWKRQ